MQKINRFTRVLVMSGKNRYMNKLILLIFLILALPFASVLTSCEHKTAAWGRMHVAESLINSRPDSAYSVLSTIDKNKLGNGEEKARYALLMSMVLDKNYIDTTSFDVLQPAIDYYIKNGSADEKLRTLYYQGRIFQNQGDDESALASFMKASEFKNFVSDSLLLAHTLVALGTIDLKQYKIEQFIKNNMDAARLYSDIGRDIFAANSYANALGGYVMLGDRLMSDSILSICFRMIQQSPEAAGSIYPAYISYIVEFGDYAELESLFKDLNDEDLSSEDMLDFARGYSRHGENVRALSILSDYESRGSILDSLKYVSIKTMILEGNGKYKDALMAYKEYSSMMERHQENLMSGNLLFVEEKYKIELNNLKKIQRRDRIIWLSLCGILALSLLVGLLYYCYCLAKSKRDLTETENKNLKLEQANLKREKEKVEFEWNRKTLEADNLEKDNKRLVAERQQQIQETENLFLEKKLLEEERDNLSKLLKQQSGLSESQKKIVRTRLSLLNGLLAKEITNQESYAKPYRKWIDSIKKDKEIFTNSTREAFSLSHPKFMKHLTSHGLTVDEINYLCLYALGLRGKDVGEYINLKRHYNVSSEIRKKLGINEHETNIGPYVRRLMDEMDFQ